jgi:ATP-dependent RNA helicase DeaD
VDLIAENTALTGSKVGDIALYDKFSFVEVPSEFAEEITSKLGRSSIQGRPVSFNIATPRQEGDAQQEGNTRGPGGFGADDNRPARRAPYGNREGGSSYGGGYKGNRDGGSSYGGGSRSGTYGNRDGGSSYGGGNREGGSSYGGGYKGKRDGGSSYGSGGGYKGKRD